jgi:hypothetical protein
LGWVEYTKKAIVCQGKSTLKYGGNTFIFRSGVNKARNFNREVEAIGERDFAQKRVSSAPPANRSTAHLPNNIHGPIRSHRNPSGIPNQNKLPDDSLGSLNTT